MNVLEVEQLNKSIGGAAVLRDISFSVEPGEVVSLFGSEPARQAALLRIIACLAFPDRGRITVCGEELGKNSEKALSHLFFLPDRFALYPQLTGREHLQMIAALRGVGESGKTAESFAGISETLLRKRTGKYTEKEQRRFLLALCLLCRPKLLLLEQPEQLDLETEEELCQAVDQLSGQGTGVLISCAGFGGLQRRSDSFLLLEDGTVEEGKLPPEDFRISSKLTGLGDAV